MKKLVLLILLAVAFVSAVNSRSFSATPAGAAPQPASARPAEGVARQSPAMGDPLVLPAAIHDPRLLAAWIGLYQQPAAIDLGEGASVSGRSLAQYALDHAIPTLWEP